MSIKIIDEPDIHLTQSQYDRLRREWEASQSFTAAPVSFDTYVRQHMAPLPGAFVAAPSIPAGVLPKLYTVFCSELDGSGTIWIGNVTVKAEADHDTEIQHAKEAGRRACAADWRSPPGDIHVLGVAEGRVNILFWEDVES